MRIHTYRAPSVEERLYRPIVEGVERVAKEQGLHHIDYATGGEPSFPGANARNWVDAAVFNRLGRFVSAELLQKQIATDASQQEPYAAVLVHSLPMATNSQPDAPRIQRFSAWPAAILSTANGKLELDRLLVAGEVAVQRLMARNGRQHYHP